MRSQFNWDDLSLNHGITGWCKDNVKKDETQLTGIQLACGQLGSQRAFAGLLEFYAVEEGVWEDWSFCPGDSFAERLQLRFDEDVWSELAGSLNDHPARRPNIRPGETKRKAELKHISFVCSGSGNVEIPSYPLSTGQNRWWTSNDAECPSSPSPAFIGGVRVRMHKGRIGLGIGECEHH